MELTVLTVPDCPHGQMLEERLASALAGHARVSVLRRVVEDAAQAARLGMHGSPTLLIDGHDPFAAPGLRPGLSCRMYPAEDGRLEGAPSIAALRAALADPLNRGRLAPEGGLRAVQLRILRSFAETGRPPAEPQPAEALAALHAADFLHLDEANRIRAAYPFSAAPTRHRVRIIGGPEVHAMCAIDALGIAPMLGADTVIRSIDPGSGEPITVTARAWDPSTSVVYAGHTATAASAAEACCGYVNFFASARDAEAWAKAHPGVTGRIMDQPGAVRLATRIFGPLLR